jgi:mono/diheme cytochrome c family protein
LTEIPEHLLERSRARRAALGLGGGESGAAPSAPAAAGGGGGEEAPKAAVPAKAAAPAPVAAKAPEVVLSPYAQAAIARKKIPFWAVPVLVFLPLWGFLYWGTLDPEPVEETGPLLVGGEVYGSSCASCHGAGGGGGVGPELETVTETFPDYKEHVWWTIDGAKAIPVNAPYGSPDRPGGQRISRGVMPGWGTTLTAEELLSVVYYERSHFGGATEEELAELEAIMENPDLPANFEEGTSLDDVRAQLEALIPEDFVPPAP